MTTRRMLIDASHPEETRVAIVNGNQLEDFDVEVESRRQLRGNIYLAKVTRVEPSLQAAFVDYGGNRHGFLAFSEIHPDYYQIPVADREALVAEHQAAESEAADLDGSKDAGKDANRDGGDAPAVETVGGDDTDEVAARRPVQLRRRYKIQEVIKRRQILLVQVVKEERGTKGAALTTYLSLAGRYCVLMPNTARGGGVSRKIGNGADRKHLKSILGELDIPKGMAVIVRTAGQKRSKAEIKRDYEYLMRVWSAVRETTLESMAPCLVHEEGNLIKRSIRDLYSKDIDEIIVDGEAAYRTAKDFMKMLIPSHTKRVQPFKEKDKQLLQHYGVESQLDSMHSPEVQLKSGGYIVINPTEALVAIDVNSGRATRGRNIEETALKTNLEAADEIARQLKLRDLAGLIVIDFIDMEVNRNQGKVERRLKDAMRADRARIQIGRISPFGLLELSRQRLRPSLIETISDPCPYCEGTGIRRSADSAALHLLRAIEDEGMKHRSRSITVYIPSSVALYMLNRHRTTLADIETKYGLSVVLETDDSLIPPDFRFERVKGDRAAEADENAADGDGAAEEGGKRRRRRRSRRRRRAEDAPEAPAEAAGAEDAPAEDAPADARADAEGEPADAAPEAGEDAPAGRAKRRRRGRRGGRRRGRRAAGQQPAEAAEGTPAGDGEAAGAETRPAASNDDQAGAAPPAGDDQDAETKDKKKPARRRARRKAEESEAAGKAEPKKKPAKKPRARKKKKAEDAAPKAAGKDAPAPAEPAPGPVPNVAETSVTIPIAPADVAALPVTAEPGATLSPDADTAKTQVINVGSDRESPGKGQTRKGWWSRDAE